jgi:hypothetical protein
VLISGLALVSNGTSSRPFPAKQSATRASVGKPVALLAVCSPPLKRPSVYIGADVLPLSTTCLPAKML